MNQKAQNYIDRREALIGKIVGDLGFVAPEAQAGWLRIKLELFADNLHAPLLRDHATVVQALEATRADLTRAGGVPPEATAFPFFKTFDVARLLSWARRRHTKDALCVVGPPASGKSVLAAALKTVFGADAPDGITIVDEAQEAPGAEDTIYLANTHIPCAKKTHIVTLTAASAVEMAKLGRHLRGDPSFVVARDFEWLHTVHNA